MITDPKQIKFVKKMVNFLLELIGKADKECAECFEGMLSGTLVKATKDHEKVVITNGLYFDWCPRCGRII